MLFFEPRFAFFFAVVFAVHWALRSNRSRKVWLLACSYVFYGAWHWKFLALILTSTLVDYVAGARLALDGTRRSRRGWLLLSLGANLGLLGVFKYLGFFVESAAQLLAWLGLPAGRPTLEIVLPVGISFYTFQSMSYTIDVYRRELAPVRSLVDFAAFVAFFPQLVAGPIVRAAELLPQLAEPRRFARDVRVRTCLALFLVGFFKKTCLADNAAVVIDRVFAEPENWSTGGTWLALALYHVQVYGDFSGYTDMATASAGLLGYRLVRNFDFPFFAGSIGEFWRRWHISLSRWIKDYLYVPLGGSRVRWPRLVLNVYLTMGLCGLWHGAGWSYVAFGLLHATYLLVNRAWVHLRRPGGAGERALRVLGLPLTFLLLLLSWAVFRGESLAGTLHMLRVVLFLEPGGDARVEPRWLLFLAACAVAHWAFYRRRLRVSAVERVPPTAFALGYGAAWGLVLPWVAVDAQPFIYFQF